MVISLQRGPSSGDVENRNGEKIWDGNGTSGRGCAHGKQKVAGLPLKAIGMHFGISAGHSAADAHVSVHRYPSFVSTQRALAQSFSPVQGSPSLPVPRIPGTQQGTGAFAVPRFSQRSVIDVQSAL
jgi:hypothetical protein